MLRFNNINAFKGISNQLVRKYSQAAKEATFVRDRTANPLNPSTWSHLNAAQVLDMYFQACSMKYLHPSLPVQKHLEYQDDIELEQLQRIAPEIGFDTNYLTTLYENGVLSEALTEIINESLADSRDLTHVYSPAALEQFEKIRSDRHYFRIKAHELPLLVEKRVPYEHRTDEEYPLKFTFSNALNDKTSQMNASCKVEVAVKNLKLNEDIKHVVRLLAGEHYNIKTDTITISSGLFNTGVQNASYLKDKVQTLVQAAKDNLNEFKDIPLDAKQPEEIKTKTTIKDELSSLNKNFPKEWANPADHVEKRIDPRPLMKSYYEQMKHLERLQHTFSSE